MTTDPLRPEVCASAAACVAPQTPNTARTSNFRSSSGATDRQLPLLPHRPGTATTTLQTCALLRNNLPYPPVSSVLLEKAARALLTQVPEGCLDFVYCSARSSDSMSRQAELCQRTANLPGSLRGCRPQRTLFCSVVRPLECFAAEWFPCNASLCQTSTALMLYCAASASWQGPTRPRGSFPWPATPSRASASFLWPSLSSVGDAAELSVSAPSLMGSSSAGALKLNTTIRWRPICGRRGTQRHSANGKPPKPFNRQK